jgi:DNA polymerase-3 subunit delta'
MAFRDLVGQEQVRQFLQGCLRQRTTAHAYIFSGKKGSGRLATARAFAQALYCEQQGDEGCGTCVPCRKFLHGNLLDYLEVAAEANKKSISIDQMRELQRHLSFRTEKGVKKIFVIEEAERLSSPAANSILKFLEEPQSDQTGILLVSNLQAIPDTILSRAQLIKFAEPNVTNILASMPADDHNPALKRLAVELAGNREGALELLDEDWFADMRELVIKLVQEAVLHPYGAVIILQQKLSRAKAEQKKQLDIIVQMLELFYRDLIYTACGRNELIVYADQQKWLASTARQKEISFWMQCAERATQLRKFRLVNANWQMILEQFFLQMKASKER